MATLRTTIAHRVRKLREEHRWTQAELAKTLGLSQNRLSELEHGKGSFTAEQLVTLLRTFNVPIDDFAPAAKPDPLADLQNALARLGAKHLAESSAILPPERLQDLGTVILEALASGEPRLITALAPVLVQHVLAVHPIRYKLLADCAELGLANRLGWLYENVVEVLEGETSKHNISPELFQRYKSAQIRLNYGIHGPKTPKSGKDEILDRTINSEEQIAQVLPERSRRSLKWHLVTRIQPRDFQAALEQARAH